MGSLLKWTAIVCTLALAAACGFEGDGYVSPAGDDDDDSTAMVLEDGPGEFDPDFVVSDDFFTLMAGPRMGESPHGEVQIWYSSNISELVRVRDQFVVPVGTVSIKTGNMDEQPGWDVMTVMIKMEPGYDSDYNDWYYDMRGPSGEIMTNEEGEPMAGLLGMCIACHQTSRAKDFLSGTELR